MIEAAKSRLLAANELFRGSDDEAMVRVSEMTAISSCAKRQVVMGPERAGEVLFLNHGGVRIYRLNAEGKKLVVHDVKPGTFFAEVSVLGQGMAGNYAETTAESLLCVIEPRRRQGALAN